MNMYILMQEHFHDFFLYNNNNAKWGNSNCSSSLCFVSSQQMPVFVLRVPEKVCYTTGIFHGATLLQGQRATHHFRSILIPKPTLLYLPPCFNVLHRLFVVLHLRRFFVRHLLYCLFNFFIKYNLQFIDSKYTLMFIAVDNHKEQYHSSPNFW